MKDLVSSNSSWDYEKALKDALRERDELLKENPSLNILQSKIDATLSTTDVFEEKMKLLGQMIGSSLNKLHDECYSLSEICKEIGIEFKLPILEIKNKAMMLTDNTSNK